MRHLPAMGGKDDGEKFDNLYQETLDLYEKMFGYPPDPLMWEPSEIRFSSELFTYSMVNLNRVVCVQLYNAFHPFPKIEPYETLNVIQNIYDYGSARRT